MELGRRIYENTRLVVDLDLRIAQIPFRIPVQGNLELVSESLLGFSTVTSSMERLKWYDEYFTNDMCELALIHKSCSDPLWDEPSHRVLSTLQDVVLQQALRGGALSKQLVKIFDYQSMLRLSGMR